MAEFTSLATRFWEDPYIQSLPPTDKLLYMYLISGPQSEPTLGIYELGLRTMAHHTGLTEANMQESLNRFAQAGKIHHVDGWIIIINHFKHNSVKSERVLIGAHKRLHNVPWHIVERLSKKDDTLYIPYLDPQHTLYIGSEPVPALSPSRPYPGTSPNPSRPGRSSRPSAGVAGEGGDEEGLSDRDKKALAEGRASGMIS